MTAIIVHRKGKSTRFCSAGAGTADAQPRSAHLLRGRAVALDCGTAGREPVPPGARGLNVEIHLDIGEQGETRELIRDVVGMIVGSGFHAEIKPHSYGASKVADRYTSDTCPAYRPQEQQFIHQKYLTWGTRQVK